MPAFLPFLQSILQEYNSQPLEMRDYFKKDGVLVAIAVLTKVGIHSEVTVLSEEMLPRNSRINIASAVSELRL
jgi:hypothetical protein